MLLIKIEGETERPLTTYYLLLSTIIILKKTMYLLCTDYVPYPPKLKIILVTTLRDLFRLT